MLVTYLNEMFQKVLVRKQKSLDCNSKISFDYIQAIVFFVFLLNFDRYSYGAVKKIINKTKKGILREKENSILNDFLDSYKDDENKIIMDIFLFFQIPENIREAFFYKYSSIDIEKDLFDCNTLSIEFFNTLSELITEYYSEDETELSICKDYSIDLPVPTNKDCKEWTLKKALGFNNLLKNDLKKVIDKHQDLNCSYHDDQKVQITQAINFFNFVDKELFRTYHDFFKVSSRSYLSYSNDFFDIRRKFLDLFKDNENRYIQIVAISFALPLRAFRSFLYRKNVDCQDIESYLRRMDDEQFNSLYNAYDLFCFDLDLPDYCLKGWKHVFHNPSLEEILDEENCKESTRFYKNWSFIKENFLGIGYVKYIGVLNDEVRIENSYFSIKDRKKSNIDIGGEFFINPIGFYGISTRKLFGNYLWGDFEEEKIGGWVCPRAWLTFFIYSMLFIASPIFFTYLNVVNPEFQEFSKLQVWLLPIALLLPFMLLVYFAKFVMVTTYNVVGNTSDYLKEKIDNFIEFSVDNIVLFAKTVNGKIVLNIFFLVFLVYLFNGAYDAIIAYSFALIIDYYIISMILKGRLISPFDIAYGKYFFAFIVLVHMVYGFEFVMFVFDFLNLVKFYLLGLILFFYSVYLLYKKIHDYNEAVNKYVVDGKNIDLDVYYANLLVFMFYCMVALFIGEIIFVYSLLDESLVGLVRKIPSSLFATLLIYAVIFYLLNRPLAVIEERNLYIVGEKLQYGAFDEKNVILAISRNKWLQSLDTPKSTNTLIYKLYYSLVSDLDSCFFIDYINRMDSNFLFEVNSLKTICKFNHYPCCVSGKLLKKLVYGKKTAREIVDIYQSKINRKEKLSVFSGKFFDYVSMTFRKLILPFVALFKAVICLISKIKELYNLFMDFFHRICAYSNTSEPI